MHRLIQIQTHATDDEISKALSTAAAHQCSGFELDCAGGPLSDTINSQSLRGALDKYLALGLSRCTALWLGTFDSGNLASADAAARQSATDELTRCVETAAHLEISRISLSPALVRKSDPNRVTYQDALNRTFAALQSIVRRLEGSGVALGLCVARNGFFMSPPELREFIDRQSSHAIGADIDWLDRDDQASTADWLATLGNLTQAVGIWATPDVNLESLDAEFKRLAPAAHASAHLVLRPQPA